MDKEAQLLRLTKKYLTAFLSFGIKKTNTFSEAEELAQEIAYQCTTSIHRCTEIHNFDAFVWSIAHNTFKKWCMHKQKIKFDVSSDTFSNIISCDLPMEDRVITQENHLHIRYEISRLSKLYRQTIVFFYYDELSIQEISTKLSISTEMVKFYLFKGRQKLKEAYQMNRVGEKSFNPSDFTIYKSAIDFSKINIWEVFKRKLPCQIAIICHDTPKTITEISIETGIPAVYIEDEIEILLATGLVITPVRNKYQTNFSILKNNVIQQINEQFNHFYTEFAPQVINTFIKHLPALKQCNIFADNVTDNRYAWFFTKEIEAWSHTGRELSGSDYPQILSCGSKAFIFGEETTSSPWVAGQTPTYLENCTIWARDLMVLGEYHCQKELYDVRKSQALYDIHTNNINAKDRDVYAQLIQEGYLLKKDNQLICNLPVSTAKSRILFDSINKELQKLASPLYYEISANIQKIIAKNIPSQLRPYTIGYTETWLSFYSSIHLYGALYKLGFITLPDAYDNTPIACYIYEN